MRPSLRTAACTVSGFARPVPSKRGAAAIVARGRSLKQSQAALFTEIQQRYGVPPGPLIAIWGMETGFGSQRGNQNMLSSIATLAYDCRRPEYFTDQLYAALKLIDRGTLSGSTRGSMHGEIGQTQVLPEHLLNYGIGNLEVAANALSSTANFLKAHGWRAGAGYQPGEPNFAAIEAWNAAEIYQKAIAIMGRQIDGGGWRGCLSAPRTQSSFRGNAQRRARNPYSPAGVDSEPAPKGASRNAGQKMPSNSRHRPRDARTLASSH